jgi:hypothetical protein
LIITGKHRVVIIKWQILWPLRVQRIDPPMLGVWGRTAEIQTPPRISWQDHRAFEGGSTESLATDLTYRLEVDSIAGLGDDDADSSTGVERPSDAVRQPEKPVHEYATGTTSPVARASVRSGDHHLGVLNSEEDQHRPEQSRKKT